MEDKVQYGVQVEPGGEVMVVGDAPGSREHAISMANALNKFGPGESYMAVERKITVTDWAPFNTGVVGPHQAADEE